MRRCRNGGQARPLSEAGVVNEDEVLREPVDAKLDDLQDRVDEVA
jgi:hypothetical protein